MVRNWIEWPLNKESKYNKNEPQSNSKVNGSYVCQYP